MTYIVINLSHFEFWKVLYLHCTVKITVFHFAFSLPFLL
jgi:hypothetical protein